MQSVRRVKFEAGDAYEIAGWCCGSARGCRRLVAAGTRRRTRRGGAEGRRGRRGGEAAARRLKLTSGGFTDGGSYPLEFTCYANGGNAQNPSAIKPPFSWTNGAQGAARFDLRLQGRDTD